MTTGPAVRPWVVRWDARESPPPAVSPPPAGDAGIARLGAGGFLLFDGVLLDREALGGPAAATDAERVAAAWERWGDGTLDRLRGAFALVAWDAAARRLAVARDAAGLGSCFFRWDGRRLLASAALDALLGEPEVSGEVSRAALAHYVADDFAGQDLDETFFGDVRRLLPGHVLQVAGGRMGVSRYWDPLGQGLRWATPAEADEFPARLERAVGRCLDGGADGIALSGGLDSVGLAVVAAGLRRGRPPLHAVSLRFDDPACDEGEAQRAVAGALGMPQTIGRVSDLAEGGIVSAALALSETSPSPVLSPWQGLYVALLRSTEARGLRRLVMGTGGDEALNVDLTHGADCLARLELGGLWRLCRAWQRTSPNPAWQVARTVLWDGAGRPVLGAVGRSALGRVAPGALAALRARRRARRAWLAPDRALARTLEERAGQAAPAAEGGAAYPRSLRRLLLSPLALLELDQGHAWTARAGCRLMLPYLDRDLLELTLRLHPDRLIAGGRMKTPLRRLLAERLPGVRLPVRKVDFGRMFDDLFRPELGRAWPAMGGARALGDLGVVDPAAVDRLMAGYLAGDGAGRFRAWLLLSTEAWVRAHRAAPVRREEVPA